MNKSDNNINTGKILNDYLQKNRITKRELGRKINRGGDSIGKYIENSSIQTGILIEISQVLKHNFLQDLADSLPKEFASNIKHSDENDQLIANLKEEIKVLQIQNELLMRMKS